MQVDRKNNLRDGKYNVRDGKYNVRDGKYNVTVVEVGMCVGRW